MKARLIMLLCCCAVTASGSALAEPITIAAGKAAAPPQTACSGTGICVTAAYVADPLLGSPFADLDDAVARCRRTSSAATCGPAAARSRPWESMWAGAPWAAARPAPTCLRS